MGTTYHSNSHRDCKNPCSFLICAPVTKFTKIAIIFSCICICASFWFMILLHNFHIIPQQKKQTFKNQQKKH